MVVGSERSAMGTPEAKLVFSVLLALITIVFSETDPSDVDILNQFRKGLDNPGLLDWPENGGDPCGPPPWNHVYCDKTRVSQIQVRGLGLSGPLPENFNKLSMLSNLGLQQNNFSGPLPSFSGLSELRYAYLDFNLFDSIPADFFDGLVNLEVLALDYTNLNASTGWSLPKELQDSLQLRNLSLMNCNLVGPLPEFLGKMSSLAVLKMSLNRISGEIPASFSDSALQILWLNDQSSGGMSGSIDVVASMVSLTSLWLHGNNFTGGIPENIGALTSLKDLNLNSNNLVGLIPDSLANMDLDKLDLNNNQLMGPIPKFKVVNASFESNSFCQSTPGIPCALEVMALLDFLQGLNYPSRLVPLWSGNDPCKGPWLGLSCTGQNVSVINLPKFGLNGNLSPSLANLDSLAQIRLEDNNLTGPVPTNLTRLNSLTLLDLSDNNVSPPLPEFSTAVKVVINGNPLLNGKKPKMPPPPQKSPLPRTPESPTRKPSPPTPGSGSNSSSSSEEKIMQKSSKSYFVLIVAPIAGVALIFILAVPISIYYCKKKKKKKDMNRTSGALVVHPRDPSDPEKAVKIAIASNNKGSVSSLMGSSSASGSSRMGESHTFEAGNFVISVQVLRNVTKHFSPENELGRGGFGVVYKGELDDGTNIAVKRMECSIINSKALGEFHAEISVLSKVRHRHLVSLLGYSIEGSEKLLVYEYMPQGALNRHLFHWKSMKLEPLSWKRRLNIALDVARGMEYLHSLAHQSFIHRDLKPSNILLGDDYRAKVSDFGLVKLAPEDGHKSVATRLAGTFGYLAPEYAVMGKITTKSDVFSYGVVLMELVTGMAALDEERPEETQYLASWFWHIKSDKKKLREAIDSALDVNEETFESICIIAELAGHCTTREPNQRPDMGHVVNVLAPLVDKWKPADDESEEYSGIDYSVSLNQMVKGWQETEGKDSSYLNLEDSKGSIPARPTGFADSFASTDGR